MDATRKHIQLLDDKIDLKIGHSDKHKVVINIHMKCISQLIPKFLRDTSSCSLLRKKFMWS